jgi:hypothetical protein
MSIVIVIVVGNFADNSSGGRRNVADAKQA